MRTWILCLGGLLMSIATGGARELQLTVYNNDLGLVRDVREIDLPSGRGTITVVDVAAQIDPTSVHLGGLGEQTPFTVLEQNFRYDIASADRLLESYIDQPVQAVLEGGELHDGTLLSFTSEHLVLQEERGLSMLQREKVTDIRMPKLPEGLITRPTLVWEIDGGPGRRQPVEMSYLTTGVSWHAEYVALTNEDDTRADLAAWVSVDNRSGASYPDARLQLIAGEVNRVQPQPPPRPMADMPIARAKGANEFQEESFFEYHLYTLPRPTTVRDRETKQIALFEPTTTPVTKSYEYQPWRDDKHVRIVLEFENSEAKGLGMPLPAGTVRTYKRDSRGGQQFVGEDRIDHTPRNEKVRLGLGNAFDVVAERTMTDRRQISDRVWEQSYQVKLRNRKTEPVTIHVEDRFWGDWRIVASSHPSEKKDANTAEWSIDVGADAEVTLTYTVRSGY
ncbi:MAG: DUF4139 domain-containing protein [Candidatus Eisenbacteria bacterium]